MTQTRSRAHTPTQPEQPEPVRDEPPDGVTTADDPRADLDRIRARLEAMQTRLDRSVTFWKVLLVVSFLAIVVGPVVVSADMFTAADIPGWVSALALAVTATRAVAEAYSPGAALAARRTMRASLGQLQCDVEDAAQAGTTIKQRNEWRRRLTTLEDMHPKDAIPGERASTAAPVEGLTAPVRP